MKIYNYENPCNKCGMVGATTRYVKHSPLNGDYYSQYDVMRRECRNCGNYWSELPLDSDRPYKVLSKIIKQKDLK